LYITYVLLPINISTPPPVPSALCPPQDGLAGLDYGTLRVCDSKALPLVFKNTGKYPVSYAFNLKNAQVRLVTLCLG